MSAGKKPRNNPAQIKGDINKGLSGDKRPGFDPAAAPLETDAEAAGTPLSLQQIEVARETQRRERRPRKSGTFGSAMRRFHGSNGRDSTGAVWLAIIVVVVLIALAAVFISAN